MGFSFIKILPQNCPTSTRSAIRRSWYEYDAGNKRVYEKRFDGGTQEWVYFFGVTGQRLARYTFTVAGSAITFTQDTASVWFGGKLVQKVNSLGSSYAYEDRLGSVGKYLPYGEDKPGASGNPVNDNEKFATYTRDANTGIDYADQRWHAQGTGRFLTADPNEGQIQIEDPSSFNRFTYALSEPTGNLDPSGLYVSTAQTCTFAQQEVVRLGLAVGFVCGPAPSVTNPNGTSSTCLGQSLIPNPMCGLIPVMVPGIAQGSTRKDDEPQCNIQLKYRDVKNVPGYGNHALLTVVDRYGNWKVIEGLPERNEPGNWGNLVARVDNLANGSIEGKAGATSFMSGGKDICDLVDGLYGEASSYNKQPVSYNGVSTNPLSSDFGPNSNSFVRYLLTRVGIVNRFTRPPETLGWTQLINGQ